MASSWQWLLFLLTALVCSVAAAVLFLLPARLRWLLDRVPFLRRYDAHFNVLNDQRGGRLRGVFLLSTSRYAVFVSQFILLLHAFNTGTELFDAVLAVPVVFLLNTLAPTMMLTELGVRASTAYVMLAPLSAHTFGIALASSVLWAVNVLLPALIGSVILLVTRIRIKDANT